MNDSKKTKKALLASVMSLVLCCAMLIGTTFAWFTDSASTSVNTIQAGTLKVDLIDAGTQESIKGEALSFKNVDGSTDILWEPGASFETETFQVKNVGNLALKYKIAMNGMQVSDNKLMEVIDLYLVEIDGSTETKMDLGSYVNHLDTKDEVSNPMKIVATMKSTAGNSYQGLTATGMSITVFATQYTYEKDITGDQYDAGALFDDEVVYVTTADELVNAFATLKAGTTISLGADIDMTGKTIIPVNGNKGFTLNGNGHTISNLKNNAGTEKGALFVADSKSSAYFFNDVTLKECSVASTSNYAALFVGDADTSGNVTINNCHAVDCTVISGKYAAAFVGYSSGYYVNNNGAVYGNFTITDCSVTGGSITGGGSTGAAIGHAGGTPATTNKITNLTVKNVAINGEDADHTGIVVGTAHVGITTITGTTVENVTGNYNTAHNLYGRNLPDTTGKLTIDGAEIAATE